MKQEKEAVISPITAEIPSGPNYDGWRIQPLGELPIDFLEASKHLLGYAILAASTHNVQPWQFGIKPKDQSIDLFVDPRKILPSSDATGRQSFISLGCALTNLWEAAQYYGIEPQVQYCPDPNNKYLGATVNLGTKGEKIDDCFQFIPQRAMNRSEYDPTKALPNEVISQIQTCVADPQLELHLIQDPLTKTGIAEFQQMADRLVIKMGQFRFELADYLLPNDTNNYVGMPGHNFGLTNEIALRMHQELALPGRFDDDLARGFAYSDFKGIISSPLLGVICASKDSRELQIKAGQAWQKMALICQKYGVNMAMTAALVEVALPNTLLKARLKTKMRPTVVFRMGYATEPRPHSPRLPVDQVILYDSKGFENC